MANVDRLRAGLLVFLLVCFSLAILLLAVLLVQRGWRAARAGREARLARDYRPLVDAVFAPGAGDAVLRALLARYRPAHVDVLTKLLRAPLRALTGDVTTRAREVAERLGLIERWRRDLAARRWWTRAEAALALGDVGHARSAPAIVAALDDPHEEVRAAAADALGRLQDPSTLAALIARLPEESRHQRARLVEAIRRFGSAAVGPLLAHGAQVPSHRALVADLLALTGGAAAADTLLGWLDDPDTAVRVAAAQGLGTIGLDDRAFYFALRALDDPEPMVRAMAARAMGRTRRPDTVPYLAAHLDDEWTVAAHSARALQQVGPAGLPALTAHARSDGPGAELARQMIWELQARDVEANGA